MSYAYSLHLSFSHSYIFMRGWSFPGNMEINDLSLSSNLKKKIWKSYFKLVKRIQSLSLITYVLVCVFGLGSWVAINGIWAELPVLLITQPECYKLAAVLSVIIQVANIGPLLYSLAKIIWFKCGLQQLHLEVIGVILIVFIGVSSSILLSFLWSDTRKIGGETHSVVLIILTFFLSLVDCTSSVVFVPFMKHFPAEYLSALYIGEGFSGVLPSISALIQGSVNNSVHCSNGQGTYNGIKSLGIRYSPDIFFLLLAVMMLMCGAAFIGLLIAPVARRVRLRQQELSLNINSRSRQSSTTSVDNTNVDTKSLVHNDQDENHDDEMEEENNTMEQLREESVCNSSQSYFHQFFLVIWNQRTPLFCLGLLSFIKNGALSAISPYAFCYYGNTILHFAIILGIFANPVGALIYTVVPSKSNMKTAVITAIVCIMSLYLMVVALTNSAPPITGLIGGIITVSNQYINCVHYFYYFFPIQIIVNVILNTMVTYTKVGIAVIMHNDPINNDTALLLNGISTQSGSLLGALLFFCLVYYTSFFQDCLY